MDIRLHVFKYWLKDGAALELDLHETEVAQGKRNLQPPFYTSTSTCNGENFPPKSKWFVWNHDYLHCNNTVIARNNTVITQL